MTNPGIWFPKLKFLSNGVKNERKEKVTRSHIGKMVESLGHLGGGEDAITLSIKSININIIIM